MPKDSAVNQTHLRWLRELTSLPTAAGREERVVAWIERWVGRHKQVQLRRDAAGNLVLQRRGRRSTRPIYFTAHLDHPAMVVTEVIDPRNVRAEFRGGVQDAYFKGSRVRLHRADGASRPGVVRELPVVPGAAGAGTERRQMVEVAFGSAGVAMVGDLLTWDLPAASVRGGVRGIRGIRGDIRGDIRGRGDRFTAPACDDLAGVAAALAAFEILLRDKISGKNPGDIRLLFTRAEEIGFIGALAACKLGTLPKGARIIALETSKSFADSPLGAGPIVRVGDRTSSFDPALTWRCSRIAEREALTDKSFRWQRKLMPGGTCEATAYQCYGHTATCLCLPLGNYHNMNEATGRIAGEVISLRDFTGLAQLLVAIGRQLDDTQALPGLRQRLDGVYARGKHMLCERGGILF